LRVARLPWIIEPMTEMGLLSQCGVANGSAGRGRGQFALIVGDD